MTIPETFSMVVGGYLAFGVLFAAPFVLIGAGRVDSNALDGTWGFRLMIFPGAVLLWPLLAKRWVTGAVAPMERTSHKELAGAAAPGRKP